MLPLASLAVFALLLSRLLGAPGWAWRAILAGAAILALASQALPAGHAYRVDLEALLWLALVSLPVIGYAVLVRRLRRRTGASEAQDAPRHPTGLVRFDDDAALARDTRAALAAEEVAATGIAPSSLSLGWRGDDGALIGHARLRITGGFADLEMLWVAPGSRRQRIGSRLLAAAEDAARGRGVARMAARVADWQMPDFFAARGFRTYAELETSEGHQRRELRKVLQ